MGGAVCERHCRPHRIYGRALGKNAGIGDVEVFEVVAAPHLIDHTEPRVTVHSGGAEDVISAEYEIRRPERSIPEDFRLL